MLTQAGRLPGIFKTCWEPWGGKGTLVHWAVLWDGGEPAAELPAILGLTLPFLSLGAPSPPHRDISRLLQTS